jgi:uncharacterized protein (DUF2236 family)
VLRLVARLAFATLPREVRDAYGVEVEGLRGSAARAAFAAIRAARPLLPHRVRFIAPYQQRQDRRRSRADDERRDAFRRSLGIRLE